MGDERTAAQMVDTHCHLDASEFDADRDAVAAAARESGVGRIVIPGVVCFTLGFQVVLSSFFLSVLGMSRR